MKQNTIGFYSMRNKRRQQAAIAVLAGLSLATALPALAQLEEVLVVAQKHEQNLQDVPTSVSAFSSELLNNASIFTIDDITAMTPGFSISNYNPVTPQPYIRGIGTNTASVGDDASVGVFVDEVYTGRAGGFRADMFDIERVEVLRGPQGTLYGRNTAGGAINILTKAPTSELEGKLELTYGDYDLFGAKGVISGPLAGDSVAGRLAFAVRERNGHTENIVTGTDLREEESRNVRAKIAVTPSDTLSLMFSADYSADEHVGPSARGFLGSADPTSDRRAVVSLNEDGHTDRDFWGVSLKVDLELGDGTLTAISAYRENDFDFLEDLNGTFFLPIIGEAEETSDLFSQELRYSAVGERWRYTVGLYYYSESVDRIETFDSSGLLGIPGSSRPLWDASNDTTSYAAFGDFSYQLSERVQLTVGGRYTRDKKEYSNNATSTDLLGFLVEEYTVDAEESWTEFTPKVTLEYHMTDQTLLYATLSEGYKSGGFNGVAASALAASTAFAPESAMNYELGVKTDLLDQRMRLNLAGFYIDYEGLQNFFIDETGVLVNATADAEIYGVELELWINPIADLDINFSYAYLDTEITGFPSDPAVQGNQLLRAPEHSASLGVQYAWSVGDLGSLVLRGDYSHQGEQFYTPENDPLGAADEYQLANARIALRHPSGWELALWGKNLTDEEYIVHAFPLFGTGFAIYGDPRTWGLSASYAF